MFIKPVHYDIESCVTCDRVFIKPVHYDIESCVRRHYSMSRIKPEIHTNVTRKGVPVRFLRAGCSQKLSTEHCVT